MVKEKRLRWGLLGTARINRALIEPLKSSNISSLAAIASRSSEKAEEYAKIWEIPRFHSSYEAMLSDPTIDVIYNSLPNSMHAEWSIKAMEMGKHVLCEKPIATSIEEMDSIISIAKKTGMVIAEAFMYRHHPQTLLIKQMVENGEIGNIQLFFGSFCYTNTRSSDPRFNPNLGGGSLWDVGCYPIGYSRFIIGQEVKNVFGYQVIGPTGIDLRFTGQMRYFGDVIAQFECSFITPFKVYIEITGDKGRIQIPEPYKPGIKTKIVLDQGVQTKTIRVKGKKLYQGEVEDIENAILLGTAPRISLDESKANIATIVALYKSARTSMPINKEK
jgi:D-xylose 1-dehydrogenase (NADP+, D-xylono-1,5-lactone-forming)